MRTTEDTRSERCGTRFVLHCVMMALLMVTFLDLVAVARDATYVDYQTGILTVGDGACVKVTVKIKQEKDDVVPTSGETWILVYGCAGYVSWTKGGAPVVTCPSGVKMPGNSEVFYFYPIMPCPASGQCQYSIFVHYLGSAYNEECTADITIYGVKHMTEVSINPEVSDLLGLAIDQPYVLYDIKVNVEDTHPDSDPTTTLVRTVPTGWVELYYDPAEAPLRTSLVNVSPPSNSVSTCTFKSVKIYEPGVVFAKYLGDIRHSESASSANALDPAGAATVFDVGALCLSDGNACKQLDRALSLYSSIAASVCAWLAAIPDAGTSLGGLVAATCTTAISSLQVAAEQVAMNHCHDMDADGLSDHVEYLIGTNRFMSDSDLDGLSDSEEIGWAGGLIDVETGAPHEACPCPKDDDSDGDTLKDGDELFIFQTSFCKPDTDNDGIWDAVEVATGNWEVALTLPNPQDHYSADVRNHANPLVVDTDGDGLPDIDEWFFANSGPRDGYVNCADSDGDGILDGYEAFEDVPSATGTDGELNDDSLPSIWDFDSDGDGLNDGEELDLGTKSLDWDSDDDDLSDFEETRLHYTDPLDDDCDNDGLTDGAEIMEHRTDPWNADTDNDHMTDAEEVTHVCAPPPDSYLEEPSDPQTLKPGVRRIIRLDPLNPDSDGDGAIDAFDTCPCFSPPTDDAPPEGDPDPTRDSDGDGTSDVDEIADGTNPYDPADHPDVPFKADLDLDDIVNDSVLLVDESGDGFADAIEIDIGDNSHVDARIPIGPGQLTVSAAGAGAPADALYVVRYSLLVPSGPSLELEATIRDLAHDLIVDSAAVIRTESSAAGVDTDLDGIPNVVETLIGTDPHNTRDYPTILYVDLDQDGKEDDGLWMEGLESRWPTRTVFLLDIGRSSFFGTELDRLDADMNARTGLLNEDSVEDRWYFFRSPVPGAGTTWIDVYDYSADGTIDRVYVYESEEPPTPDY